MNLKRVMARRLGSFVSGSGGDEVHTHAANNSTCVSLRQEE